MIIRTDINGTVCATVRLTITTETDSGGAEEVRALCPVTKVFIHSFH
jgi:hypothetical protein